MKPALLSLLGGLLLLACMLFALLHLDTADDWIALWTPFVIAGVALAVAGAIATRHHSRRPGPPGAPHHL